MATNISKSQIVNMYKSLIRESKKFPAYNFRNYALRKIRDSFKENKTLTDPKLISERFAEANKNLELIKRQVIISQMYSTDKLVVETLSIHKG